MLMKQKPHQKKRFPGSISRPCCTPQPLPRLPQAFPPSLPKHNFRGTVVLPSLSDHPQRQFLTGRPGIWEGRGRGGRASVLD